MWNKGAKSIAYAEGQSLIHSVKSGVRMEIIWSWKEDDKNLRPLPGAITFLKLPIRSTFSWSPNYHKYEWRGSPRAFFVFGNFHPSLTFTKDWRGGPSLGALKKTSTLSFHTQTHTEIQIYSPYLLDPQQTCQQKHL